MNEPNFSFRHPKGTIYAIITPRGLSKLHLPMSVESPKNEFVGATADVAAKLSMALKNYFAGHFESFANIPLDVSGTPFQQQVWAAARALAWGQTCSYGDIAQNIGYSVRCARAVGQALGANPIPIIIPCHRILAHNGKLGGFSCGLDWKCELLKIERKM